MSMSPCGYSQTHTLQLNTVQPILFVFDYCSPCQPDSNHLASHTFPMACHILYVMEDVTTPRHIRRVPNKPNYLLQRVWCRLQIEYVAVGVKLSHLSRSRRVRADEARGALDGTWPRAGRDRGRAIESGAGDARRPIPCTKMAKRMDSRRRDRACIRNLSSMDRSRRRRPAAIARTPHVVPLPFLLCAGSLVLVHHMLAACMHGEPPPPPGILIESVSPGASMIGLVNRPAPRPRGYETYTTTPRVRMHGWWIDPSPPLSLRMHATRVRARAHAFSRAPAACCCPRPCLTRACMWRTRRAVAVHAAAPERANGRWIGGSGSERMWPVDRPASPVALDRLWSRALWSLVRAGLFLPGAPGPPIMDGGGRAGRAGGGGGGSACPVVVCIHELRACAGDFARRRHMRVRVAAGAPRTTRSVRIGSALLMLGPRPGVALKEYGGSCSLSWSIVGSIVAGGFCCGEEGAESETMSAVHAVSGSRA
jgi:hypothetical protein